MNFTDYQDQARRTAGSHFGPREAMANWAMGLAGEAGELVDLLKKEIYHDRPASIEQFRSEAGDVLWYLAMICWQRGVSLDEVATCNLEKLRKRYPEGFETGGGRGR